MIKKLYEGLIVLKNLTTLQFQRLFSAQALWFPGDRTKLILAPYYTGISIKL